MPAAGFMRADCFIWHIADTAFDAVVDADLAHGTERFVVESWDTQRGPQFFVEPSQAFEMCGQGGQLQTIIGQQKFLVACVPKPRKPALQHDRRHDCHLVEVVRTLAKLRAATVFFDAYHAARAANSEAQRRQIFHLLWCKSLFDIPHGALSLVNAESSVKRPRFQCCASFAAGLNGVESAGVEGPLECTTSEDSVATSKLEATGVWPPPVFA